MIILKIVRLLAFIICLINFLSYAQTDDEDEPIITSEDVELSTELELKFDPPYGHSSATALGVFVWASDPNARIYYEAEQDFTFIDPTLNSSFATLAEPYIQLDTPFKASRNRTLTIVAVVVTEEGIFRSEQHQIRYFVEAAERPFSYGFLIPGIESSGYFVQFGMEIEASARAQVAGGQEFADFFSELGLGTYENQIQALDLTAIDPELIGFEGGFPVNTTTVQVNDTSGATINIVKHYGFLIPYHNGEDFFGKVVRINLREMVNASRCALSYYLERYDEERVLRVNSTSSREDACVTVIDLASAHPFARGFRRGFVGYPYGFLSPGQYSVLARIDFNDFRLNTTRFIDLNSVDSTYGGYSGGFADGTWACFNPYRTYSGPVGGIRSTLQVDAYHLRPYYYSILLCVNETGWDESVANDPEELRSVIRTIDFGIIEESLRGFSDALRVGRYAYLTPLNSAERSYSSKLIRITLGNIDIGTTLDDIEAAGSDVREIIDILDLSKKDTRLAGFSGLFDSGQYLFLVPFRNAYEPSNGQRGHGLLTRLDMNSFSLDGIIFLDLPTTTRTQIPSFADFNLRGFSAGFASGKYGLLVPFFNAKFNGKIARFLTLETVLDGNLQELDVEVDRLRPNVYHGFRGGFASLWQGVEA